MGGWSKIDHKATLWLHLASWNLLDSQLSWVSKMEPSVVIMPLSYMLVFLWCMSYMHISWRQESETLRRRACSYIFVVIYYRPIQEMVNFTMWVIRIFVIQAISCISQGFTVHISILSSDESLQLLVALQHTFVWVKCMCVYKSFRILSVVKKVVTFILLI